MSKESLEKINELAGKIQRIIEDEYSLTEIDKRQELRDIYLNSQKIADLTKEVL